MCNFPEEQLAHLDGKLLHKDNYRRILDFDNVRITSDGISCRWDGCSATFYFCDLDIRYPDVQKTLRNSRALPDCLLAHIGFGLELLAILSDAMAGIATSGDGFRHVKFTFKGDSNPAIITCKEYESMALIMPMFNM
jgi:hypothetical protein